MLTYEGYFTFYSKILNDYFDVEEARLYPHYIVLEDLCSSQGVVDFGELPTQVVFCWPVSSYNWFEFKNCLRDMIKNVKFLNPSRFTYEPIYHFADYHVMRDALQDLLELYCEIFEVRYLMFLTILNRNFSFSKTVKKPKR